MNLNARSSVIKDNNSITLEDIKKNPEKIKDLDDKTLNNFFEEEISKTWDKDYKTIGLLAAKIAEKKTVNKSNPSVMEQLVQDHINEEEAIIKQQQEIVDLKNSENQEEKNKKIEDLKKQLEDSEQQKKTLEELVKNFEESEKNNRQENSKLLEDIKAAKESWDTEKVKKLQEAIKKITLENKALKDKFAGELPKYDSKDIATLKTRWIWFKFAWKMNIDGQTVLTWPQLLFRNNIRSRNRINKTVNKLNEIWKDPRKWVNYIMTKASLSQWWRLWTWFKKIKNFFAIRDTNKFDEVFNAHKKQFIDDLESKMSANSMSDADKKTITAIKARLDYYQKAYKRQFITV